MARGGCHICPDGRVAALLVWVFANSSHCLRMQSGAGVAGGQFVLSGVHTA